MDLKVFYGLKLENIFVKEIQNVFVFKKLLMHKNHFGQPMNIQPMGNKKFE